MTAFLADAAGIAHTVTDGPFLVAAGLSVAAGVVSFASPCVVPLVPGYLSYLLSLVGAEAREPAAIGSGPTGGVSSPSPTATLEVTDRLGSRVRSRAVAATALFVAGFSIVFIGAEVLAFGAQRLIFQAQISGWVTRVAGVVIIVLGLAMLGLIRPLQREWRIHRLPQGRFWAALPLGVFFGLGWTVCIGPTLAGVISLANATEWNGNAWRGLFLIVFYCAGLGVPFLVLAFGFGWATAALGFLRRNTRTIQLVGAGLLIAVGLAMVTGLWSDFVIWIQHRVNGTTTAL